MPEHTIGHPWFRRPLVWAIVVVVALLIATVGIWFHGRSSLNAQMAAIKQRGLPTTFEELDKFYRVPDSHQDTTESWTAAVNTVTQLSFGQMVENLPLLGTTERRLVTPDEDWPELENSRTKLLELSDELAVIHNAAAAGGVARFPVDFSAGLNMKLPFAVNCRTVQRLLILDAYISAHDGDFQRTHRDLLAVFAVSDCLMAEPTLMSQLIRNAVHGAGCQAVNELLVHCQWSDAQLKQLQAAIAAADFKQGMRQALAGELPVCLSAAQQMPLGPFRSSSTTEFLNHFQQQHEALDGTWLTALEHGQKIDAELVARTKSTFGRLLNMPQAIILPAAGQALIAAARSEASRNCTFAAVAAERFRVAHGRLPRNLDELNDQYLPNGSANLDVDPFSDKRLQLKSDHAAITIYSIGENQTDDGGDIVETDPNRRPLDLGVQLKQIAVSQ